MKAKTPILIFLLLTCFSSFAQLRIEDCYAKAQANYPLIKQYELIEKTKEYNLANANKGYLPQLTFSAKASYQSEVTKMPIDFSQMGIQGIHIPVLSKDQYNLSLDLSQTIWDGGAIKSQKQSMTTAAEIEKKQVATATYAINERLNQVYFGILLSESQIQQNLLLQADLERNYGKAAAYVQNGIANQADLDAIKIEQLKAKQSLIQFKYTKKAYIEILSLFIGEVIEEDMVFIRPNPTRPISTEIHRPELEVYKAKIQNLEAQNQEITTGLRPKLGLFGTGGYGKPGLNMLEDNFSTYYLGGIRLIWDLRSFYSQKNSRKKILSNIEAVEVERKTFLFHTKLDITQKDNTIAKYDDQLKYDEEIIKLRSSVKLASEAKMSEGVLSGTDLTRDINAEQMARQDKILHETERLLAIYNLKFATNN